MEEKAKKKAIPSFRKRLTASCNAAGPAVSFWGITYKGGAKIHPGKICHASFRCDPAPLSFYENISNHFKNKVKDKKAYREYVNYVMNGSPWARCFVTKKFGIGLRHNIEMDIDVGPSEFMAAITALRMGSEYPTHLKLWVELRKKYKCSDNEAMLIASLFNGREKSITPYRSNHWIIGSNADVSRVISFFKNGYSQEVELTVRSGNRDFRIWRRIYSEICISAEEFVKVYPEVKYVKPKNAWDRFHVDTTFEYLVSRTKELYAQA